MWTGSILHYEEPDGRVGGPLSADGRTLVSVFAELGGQRILEWKNLPLDPALTTPDLLVFGVSGAAARDHVVIARSFLCASDHDGIDYTKPVRLEVRLGK